MTGNGRKSRWVTRENILFTLGIAMMVGTWINSEVFGRPFHYEFLIAGMALCGVGIASLGDRK